MRQIHEQAQSIDYYKNKTADLEALVHQLQQQQQSGGGTAPHPQYVISLDNLSMIPALEYYLKYGSRAQIFPRDYVEPARKSDNNAEQFGVTAGGVYVTKSKVQNYEFRMTHIGCFIEREASAKWPKGMVPFKQKVADMVNGPANMESPAVSFRWRYEIQGIDFNTVESSDQKYKYISSDRFDEFGLFKLPSEVRIKEDWEVKTFAIPSDVYANGGTEKLEMYIGPVGYVRNVDGCVPS